MKTCPRCLRTKTLEEFSVDRWKKDKRFSYCKECCRERYQEKNKEQIRAWQLAHPDKISEYQKNYMAKPEVKARVSKLILKAYKLDPEKVNCRNRAWEHRKTILGPACESCGSHHDLILHHWVYLPPYHTETLCRPCLKKLPHRRGRENPGHTQFKFVPQSQI